MMNTKAEKRDVGTSGRLLSEKNPEALSLEVISKKREMKGFDIFTLAGNEEQVYKQLLIKLEKELNEIVHQISSGKNSPEMEFEMLFKHLHRLFNEKSYYLTVIFDKDLRSQYSDADKIISRIKGIAISYLAGLIDRGKAKGEFTTEIKTKILVKEILGSFQALMNERQLTDKMIRELKKYRSSND